MSLTLALAVTVGGTALACAAFRLLRPRAGPKPMPDESTSSLKRRGFTLEVGEVVGLEDSEYCLENGYLLHEDEEPLAAVFFLDHAQRVVVLPGRERQIYLGRELGLDLPKALPPSLELEGAEYQLEARFPARVEVLGMVERPPDDSLLWARYTAIGDATLWVMQVGEHAAGILCRRIHPSAIFSWGTPPSCPAP